MSGRFSITLSFEDYLAANWLKLRRRWIWRGALKFILGVGAIYLALGLSVDAMERTPTLTSVIAAVIEAILLAIAVLIALSAYWLWCIPRSARRIFAEQPLVSQPTEYEFDEVGLRVRNPRESSDLLWEHIISWIEDDRLLMLNRTHLTFFPIPKSQIDPISLAELINCLKLAAVKKGV